MWPQWAQRRRWNHQPPTASHSTQPVPDGGSSGWIASAAIRRSPRSLLVPFDDLRRTGRRVGRVEAGRSLGLALVEEVVGPVELDLDGAQPLDVRWRQPT